MLMIRTKPAFSINLPAITAKTTTFSQYGGLISRHLTEHFKWLVNVTLQRIIYRHLLEKFPACEKCNFKIYMSHFAYVCKMRCPLNLVLESWEYLWSYLTFWVAILDYGLKLHKLSIHTLIMLQK